MMQFQQIAYSFGRFRCIVAACLCISTLVRAFYFASNSVPVRPAQCSQSAGFVHYKRRGVIHKCLYATKEDVELSPYEAYMKQRAEIEMMQMQPTVVPFEPTSTPEPTITGEIEEKTDMEPSIIEDNVAVIEEITNLELPITDEIVDIIEEKMEEIVDIIEEKMEEIVEDRSVTEMPQSLEAPQDQDLSLSVKAEMEKMNLRSDRMSSLSSRLQQSMSRRTEIEKTIAAELASITEKLNEELVAEKGRQKDLLKILQQFDRELYKKKQLIEQEKDLLIQMMGINEQVKEESIRAQFEAAMSKKVELIDIEVNLCSDMNDCKKQLEEELAATITGVEKIDGVLFALPKPGDNSRARAYNWEDLEGLQELLISSAKSMAESSMTVAALRERFDSAARQKKEVLREDMEQVEEVVVVPEIGVENFGKLSIGEALELTVDELTNVAKTSSIDAANAFGKTLKLGSESLGNYLRSPKAQSTAATVVDLVEATSSYFKAVKGSFSAALRAFDNSKVPESEIKSFDIMFKRTVQGIQSVKTSDEVANALKEVKQLGGEISGNVNKLEQLAGESIKEASQNKELTSALSEVLTGVQSALVALAGLGSKIISNVPPPGRMLSPSSEPESASNSMEPK